MQARVIIQYSAHLAVSEEGLIYVFELQVGESPWFELRRARAYRPFSTITVLWLTVRNGNLWRRTAPG